MCGLIVANTDVKDAVALMSHRGIRQKIVDAGDFQYGHVRLPIVGLGTEWDQPVRCGEWWTLGFVGEILDFGDHDPTMVSDLEMVERTWMKDGPFIGGPGFFKFDGFWSVVAVHRGHSEIHAVVDYLDQKPLYYRDDFVTAIGSEPAAVASLAPTTPDEVYLSACVKWGYCPDVRRTPYAEIKKTVPGEYLILCPGEEPQHCIVDRLTPLSGVQASTLKEEIEAAVRRRVLSSDVPVAALVSGGLDSAIVWHLASLVTNQVRPYFADIGNPEDWEHARTMLDKPTIVKPSAFPLEKALAWMQEPVDLGSLVPQCALSEAAGPSSGPLGRSANEHVCLTGDGADEFFGGYSRAQRYDSQASDVFHELVAWHLPRLDRIMMRNQVEVRSPFLARNVARVALGLPRAERTGKKILRDLFREDLPPGIADQEKRPLRTREVEEDPEGRSKVLVDMFRRMTWGS